MSLSPEDEIVKAQAPAIPKLLCGGKTTLLDTGSSGDPEFLKLAYAFSRHLDSRERVIVPIAGASLRLFWLT
ncbi:MAG TPA: hypothetical protein VMH85_22045 [Terriglobales bacterium]|nr:hypothetical protein [Terriglobales bacterium]